MAKSKKKTVSRSRVAALLVILVLLAAVSLEVARVYGSRLPELRSKSQALDAQIQQTEKQNDVLRSDLDHEGDPDFIQGLARDDLGLASDGERIFYDVNTGHATLSKGADRFVYGIAGWDHYHREGDHHHQIRRFRGAARREIRVGTHL